MRARGGSLSLSGLRCALGHVNGLGQTNSLCILCEMLLDRISLIFLLRPSNDMRMAGRVIVVLKIKTNVIHGLGRHFCPAMESTSSSVSPNYLCACVFNFFEREALNTRDRRFRVSIWFKQFSFHSLSCYLPAFRCEPCEESSIFRHLSRVLLCTPQTTSPNTPKQRMAEIPPSALFH